MKYRCTNGKMCKYGIVVEDDNNSEMTIPAEAHSQHKESWESGKPRHFGLCLNCLDDHNREEQMMGDLI